jgi:hypothetical protein
MNRRAVEWVKTGGAKEARRCRGALRTLRALYAGIKSSDSVSLVTGVRSGRLRFVAM